MSSSARGLPILLVLALVLRAQAAPARQVSYVDAVGLYKAGRYDEAVEAVRALPALERIRTPPELFRRAWSGDTVTLRALVALQTEAKLGLTVVGCIPLTVSAQVRSPELAGSRVLFSGTLYDLLLTSPGNDAFLRAHALLVTAYDQGAGAWREALSCHQRAPERIRQTPEMWLALGAIHETAWRIEHEDGVDIDEMRPNLGDAETALRAAVAQAPALEEAWLRLAHVLTLRNRDDEALRVLRSAPIHGTGFAYLARLFEGAILERSGSFDEAAAQYRAAAALMPDAQSAPIADAHLTFRRGNRDRAAEQVHALAAASPPTEVADPWIWYTKGTAWRGADYLDEMRRLVRSGK